MLPYDTGIVDEPPMVRMSHNVKLPAAWSQEHRIAWMQRWYGEQPVRAIKEAGGVDIVAAERG